MNFSLNLIHDKVEFFESPDLTILEKKINEQIDHNNAIMLEVHSISHQMHVDADGKRFYSAVVHFKLQK